MDWKWRSSWAPEPLTKVSLPIPPILPWSRFAISYKMALDKITTKLPRVDWKIELVKGHQGNQQSFEELPRNARLNNTNFEAAVCSEILPCELHLASVCLNLSPSPGNCSCRSWEVFLPFIFMCKVYGIRNTTFFRQQKSLTSFLPPRNFLDTPLIQIWPAATPLCLGWYITCLSEEICIRWHMHIKEPSK